MQGGRAKIAAGVAKATSRTILRPTTMQVEIAAACSKNGFLEVPYKIKRPLRRWRRGPTRKETHMAPP